MWDLEYNSTNIVEAVQYVVVIPLPTQHVEEMRYII